MRSVQYYQRMHFPRLSETGDKIELFQKCRLMTLYLSQYRGESTKRLYCGIQYG
ncbi:hypothetical protein M413DRAFT_196568 [Hebeloma cylindrosporum]|uniref:Uncharacterized protein n=1 Tax=Hebeloma cylindrosporum TaxID=76867 RepID=A0A0C3C4T4_HEBCY|nr:hypothetical protein M413DRAFT_196568 [Hebeloma cylindrosporum h7]